MGVSTRPLRREREWIEEKIGRKSCKFPFFNSREDSTHFTTIHAAFELHHPRPNERRHHIDIHHLA